jgi:hypothetical protein
LDITETNQRVLLHRPRAEVRQALVRVFNERMSLDDPQNRKLTCQGLVELVTDYLERALLPAERVCFSA